MKNGFVALCLFISAGFLPEAVQAAAQDQGPESGISLFGQWKARPSLSVQSTYNDNINLTAQNEASDLITYVSPALSVEHPLSDRGMTSLGYVGDFAYYSENSGNDWQSTQIDFALDYTAPAGVIIGIADSFRATEDLSGALNEYGEGERKKRWTNNFDGKIGYDFRNRLKIFGFISYYKQDYDNDLIDWSQDYESKEYGVGWRLRIMPKTWAFARYFYGETDYTTPSPAGFSGAPVNDSNDADFSWNRFNVGLTTDPTSKLRGELNFGYTWKTYDNEADKDGNPYHDKNTWIAGTNLEYLMSPKTTVGISIMRALWESSSGSNEFYESLELGSKLRHKFFTKFTLNGAVSARFNEYNTPSAGPKRSDDRYNVELGLNYQVNRWFSVGTKYNFIDRNSNFSANSYSNNQITFLLSGSI